MGTLALVFATSISTLALGFSVVSIAYHWARRNEHPDVTQVNAAITHIRTEIADLTDRFEHWSKRERVRRLRKGREDASAADDAAAAAHNAQLSSGGAASPADLKAELRRKAFGFAAGGTTAADTNGRSK